MVWDSTMGFGLLILAGWGALMLIGIFLVHSRAHDIWVQLRALNERTEILIALAERGEDDTGLRPDRRR